MGRCGLGPSRATTPLDTDCNPIPQAVLEVWQADPSGGYDNDSAEMRYRGQLAADASGSYSFHSLVPGRYLNGATFRPAHVHVKLWVGGLEQLTTQLYFRDDPFNESDPFIESSLILDYSEDAAGNWAAAFDFVLPLP